jgi:hypothetical protein
MSARAREVPRSEIDGVGGSIVVSVKGIGTKPF